MLVVRHPNGKQYTIESQEEFERFYQHRGFTVVRSSSQTSSGGDGDTASTVETEAQASEVAPDNQATESPADSAPAENDAGVFAAGDFDDLNVPEIRDIARALEVSGQSTMNRDDLINALVGKPKVK